MSFIILDRDGVINYDSEEYIKSPDEWTAIPGSLEAIAQLNRAGFRVLIVTNQSGVGRGYYDLEALNSIHEKLITELAAVGGYIEEIFFCPHQPSDQCACRKPKPGLLNQIHAKYDIDFSATYFIGDSITDLQAALATGCQPVLVLSGKGQKTWQENPNLFSSVPYFTDLATAVEHILKGHL